MELLFLRNAEQGYERALGVIRDVILSTRGVLKIAVAYFNHSDIADWILQRNQAQGETRLLVNSSDLVRPVEGAVEYELSEPLMRVVRNSHMSETVIDSPPGSTVVIPGRVTREWFLSEVVPSLRDIPVEEIAEAVGLSEPYCAKIRAGRGLPNRKHWHAFICAARIGAEK